jgi:FkbM family methyltransferase
MEVFTDKLTHTKFCMRTGNECSDHILEHGIFESELIKWSLRFITKTSTFVDIGSHFGTYSMLLSKRCKLVYAFEPQIQTFECLKGTIAANLSKNIIAHNTALGSENTKSKLCSVSEDGGSSLSTIYSENTSSKILNEEVVQVRTLDSFNLNNIDFIKIDVEGWELEVVKGMTKTLETNGYPPFIFEAWVDEWYSSKKEELINYITALGYNVDVIEISNNMFLAHNHKESTKKYIREYNESFLELNKKSNEYMSNGDRKKSYLTIIEAVNKYVDSSYLYLCDELISIISYYYGDISNGLKSCNNIISSYDHSWKVRNSSLSNIQWYTDKLKYSKITKIICPEIPKGYFQSSSSIIENNDGFILNIRLVNYEINKNGGYNISNSDNIVRSKNILLFLDRNLKLRYYTHIVDKSDIKLYETGIMGIEDIRLIKSPSTRKYFSCVRADIVETRTPQVCLCEYNLSGDVLRTSHLKYKNEISCEKNWLPFFSGDILYFIYNIKPLILCKLDTETGSIEKVKSLDSNPDNIDDFRGSAPPIPYKNGWLFTTHQVHFRDPRIYYHRFMWMSSDFNELKYSRIFYIEKVGIEFNLSICAGKSELLFIYSVNDSGSCICHVEYSDIDDMLFKNEH